GLILVEEFVSPEEEEALVAVVDEQPWSGHGIGQVAAAVSAAILCGSCHPTMCRPNPEMRRRTQHYGYEFSYQKRKVMRELDMPMPRLFTTVIERIVADPRGLWRAESLPPDSVIVNEYERGQGIMPHTDAPSAFGPVVASLSLLSDCLFTFYSLDDPNSTLTHHLVARRSLVIMRGFARYRLRHGISKDPVEYHHDEVIERSRRVSLTIRRI
ncbi:hypothetical protein SYNPS1DRAFT_4331, partial [Syncephalis pseudoplumigaleata]